MASLYSLVLRLRVRPEPTRVKHFLGAPLQGRILAFPANIRLGCKKHARDKHSILLCTFISYEDYKVLGVQLQE